MLRAQGVFLGRGTPGKVAFLYTGQGSQYVNMLHELREREPIVAATMAEADRVMTPLLGRPLSEYVFAEHPDAGTTQRLARQLMQTEITQPAVLATDLALTRLLAAYGVRPDLVIGHSLGEYGALVAAGVLSFDAALEAVSARGRGMAGLAMADNGAMAAVTAPLDEIERVVTATDGYVVIANLNSTSQAVIGGATDAVNRAVDAFRAAGLSADRIPVSHAFHTAIVAPVSEPLTAVLRRLDVRPPALPIVSNVTGDFYPPAATPETIVELLGRQVASPVQFVSGLRTLYAAGARIFVEVGPKKALQGFTADVLGDDVLSLYTNHPKTGDIASFNQALCGLYAAGLGFGEIQPAAPVAAVATTTTSEISPATTGGTTMTTDRYTELGHLFADAIERGLRVYSGATSPAGGTPAPAGTDPVVVTGAALGLPGVPRVFDDENLARILAGQQFIDTIPHGLRRAMVDRHITRLVKPAAGDPTFVPIDSEADVIKLAGRGAHVDIVTEFGVDPAREAALDRGTKLAVGAGFDALRDAGIPLVMHYKTSTLGTRLPDRWGLPESLRDDTGVIFASAFPGLDNFARDLERYYTDRSRRDQLAALEAVRARIRGDEPAAAETDRRIRELRHLLDSDGYTFDRRFLFRILSMGHAQFAEIIGARGPNTQINAACASTTQAVALAEDWIRAGRCRRVVVISADDATTDTLLPWLGSGFLASGAAATDDVVEEAAMPFDRRRHGMIVGMGAAAFVVESAAAARERGLQPICEVLGAVTANSAFHGTRLDVDHIGQVMEQLIRQAEARGVDRHAIAPATAFVSHETYTPARGGSAAAEINALRRVFGADADAVVITNTKGFTGHAMGAGIEDVVAIKALETGLVPPVPNFKEPDPELGRLNLSTGGAYPVRYALRLAAGFGSQIAMSLLRWTPPADGQHRSPRELGYAYRITDPAAWQRWLAGLSGGATDLEVVQRRLRIADTAPAAAPAVVRPQPPAPVSVPEPAPIPPAAPVEPVTTSDEITEAVVGIVSQLTGYPSDLLDLDLDLEADLGVDTVKQAEVFAAVRERFGVAREDALRLRDFPTLTHVIGWVREKTAAAAPVAAAAAAAAPPPAEVSPFDGTTTAAPDEITEAVVGIVSRLTGYPSDLLDLDLDLEADLGVDTVKQAEVFAAVRERFGVARDDALRLRDFPTLTHVIGWVRERLDATPAVAPAELPAPATTGDLAPAPTVTGSLTATDRITRRVPVPALRPELAGCLPTGVVLDGGTRILVMPDSAGTGEALAAELREHGAEVLMLRPGEPDHGQDDFLAAGPVHGVYWLAGLDDEGPLDQLDADGWHAALQTRVRALHTTMRRCYEHSPFLVTGTRLGGYHGYHEAGATCPLGGAVTGFAKAYRRERPDALVKAVDFGTGPDPAALATRLIEETLGDPGCVEVGYADGHRWGVGLAERPFPAGDGALGPDQVFVITGAAGSIVSAITADLAAACRGTFHLLDLTPEPDPADADLRRYTENRDALKTELAARMREHGDRPTPARIERELAHLERRQAALTAIQAIERAGGTAHYHQVDLTDPDAVRRALTAVREQHDRVDVLLHAAGVEISHLLPDKEPNEFGLVLGVKADGLHAVLRALDGVPLGTVIAFSSIAGRFGNAGQTDYSAANDLQCKILSSLRRTRPDTRVCAVDWTAWGDIGMATRGSIPAMMAQAGVEMLPAEAGVAWIRRELATGVPDREVLVAGALGALAGEPHDSGGVDPAAWPSGGAFAGRVARFGLHDGLVVESTLDPVQVPFLDHHRIDGVPVLPGVMGIEAFAEAARLLVPGAHVTGAADVDFLAPVKFHRDEPRTLTVTALVRPDGAGLAAECRLTTERTLPGADRPQRTVHFTGTIRLAAEPPDAEQAPAAVPEPGDAATLTPADVYRLYFHGPAYQVVEAAWPVGDGAAARYAADLPAATGEPTLTAARLLELCFQTAGLVEAGHEGRLALPRHLDTLRLGAAPAERAGLLAVVAPDGTGGFDARVVDGDTVVLAVRGYRSVPLPDTPPEQVIAPIRSILRRG
ncbi:SDR family NAD(P)-dependent oxidoreductase [Actinoplanes oblitus]